MLYPQQNRCRNVLDLGGIWDFQPDPDQIGEQQGWQCGLENPRPIAVPGSWNEQHPDLYNYLGLAWYVKKTYLPQGWQDQRVFIRVGSACYSAAIYVNGIKSGTHEGGHLPFALEITPHIRWNEENIIAISVENELKPERVPSGNTGTPLLPIASFPQTTFDFFPYAGIHRPVVLYTVPQIFIDDVTVTTTINGADGLIRIRARLNSPVNLNGKAYLENKVEVLLAELVFLQGLAETELDVHDAMFWSDENPYLYDLTLQLPNDHYQLKIGIRTIQVESGRILLNGKPVKLNGFGRHEDFFASGRGLNLPLMVKDFNLMRWTGANSYRTSHYPYSEEEMQLADRQGFLIINEIPAVSLQFEDDALIANRLRLCLQQIEELIARDKNHPSVIMWSVANEPILPRSETTPNLEGISPEQKTKDFLNRLIGRARELDPSRPVTFVQMGGTPTSWLEQCDVICINRYFGWYVQGGELDKATAAFERDLDRLWQQWLKPVIVTEFGADTVAGLHGLPELMWTEEYQAEMIRSYLAVASQKAWVAGMQVWNFADFAAAQSILRVGGMNLKGVFTRQRTPKMAAYVLREFWK